MWEEEKRKFHRLCKKRKHLQSIESQWDMSKLSFLRLHIRFAGFQLLWKVDFEVMSKLTKQRWLVGLIAWYVFVFITNPYILFQRKQSAAVTKLFFKQLQYNIFVFTKYYIRKVHNNKKTWFLNFKLSIFKRSTKFPHFIYIWNQ